MPLSAIDPAANLAEINNYIFVDTDGSTRVKESELITYLRTQFGSVAGTNATYSQVEGAAIQVVERLKSRINREAYTGHSAWPGAITSSESVKARLKVLQDAMQNEVEGFQVKYRAVEAGLVASARSLFDSFIGANYPGGIERLIEARTYVETFVTDWGEESAPSPASAIIEQDQNDTSQVVCSAPPGGRNITKRRLYRSATGTQSSAFQLQGEYPIAQTTIADSKKQEFLGEACPTFGWIEPPAGLQGLVSMPNGMMLGFSGRTLHACEPYHPYAWPAKYDKPLDFDIIGLVVVGQSVFVATKGNPYIVTGADAMSLTAEKLASNQAGVARKSMVAVGGSVLYATPDGIGIMEGGQVVVVTENLISKADWQAYNPASIRAAEYEGRYYAFFTRLDNSKGCLVLDYVAKTLVELDEAADAVFSDRTTDTLYLLSGTSIKNVFPTVAANRTSTWKSGVYRMGLPTAMAWLHVDAEFSDGMTPTSVTVKVYGDGVLRHTASVASNRPVRLPSGKYTDWQVEVISDSLVTGVVLASSAEELKAVQ